MAVLKEKHLETLLAPIRTLAQRMFDMIMPTFSGDDFVATFIAPGDAEILRKYEALTGDHNKRHTVYTKLVSSRGVVLPVLLSFRDGTPIALPKYFANGPVKTAPPEVMHRLTEWIDERIRLGCAFGTASSALKHVWAESSDDGAVAVAFNALPLLMGMCGDPVLQKRAGRLINPSKYGRLAMLSAEQRDSISDACALLVSASMLTPDAAVLPKHGWTPSFNGPYVNPNLFSSRGLFI